MLGFARFMYAGSRLKSGILQIKDMFWEFTAQPNLRPLVFGYKFSVYRRTDEVRKLRLPITVKIARLEISSNYI